MARSASRSSRHLSTIAVPTRVLRSQNVGLNTTSTSNPTLSAQTKTQHSTKRRKRLDLSPPKRKKNPHPPPTNFTCRICISHLPHTSFIPWSSTRIRHRYVSALEIPPECILHLARNPARRNDPVCRSCIGSFMAARLDTHGAQQVSIGCVEPGCTTTWPSETVMAFFPKERMEEYNDALFEDWRVKAGLFTCLADGCGFTGLLDERARGYPHVSCNTCGFRACAECRITWHKEQTCAEVSAAAVTAQLSDDEMEMLRQVQGRGGKRCPHCQLVVEKEGGCPSMFCPGCQRGFDWDAAASAVPGAKRALPIKHGQAYYARPGAGGCEVDDETRGMEEDEFERWLRDIGMCGVTPVGFVAVDMPLPDEEDADL